MRRPIRLNESDITRIVRRVINENDKGSAFLSAVDNDGDGEYDDYDGTNDAVMTKVVMSIKSKEEYDTINSYVMKKTKKSVITWIRLETDDDFVKIGNHTLKMFCHLVSLGVTVNGYDKLFCQSEFYKNISCVDRMSLPNAEGDFSSHPNNYGNIRNIDGSFYLYQGQHFFCKIK
jgi:hypothetical protein